MKTLQQIIDAVKEGKAWERENCEFLDGRDLRRILSFCNNEQVGLLGFKLNDPNNFVPQELTEEVVVNRLVSDLRFAAEKACDERGISASLMWDILHMWLWILEDYSFDSQEYDDYGRSFIRAVNKKYLPEEILPLSPYEEE